MSSAAGMQTGGKGECSGCASKKSRLIWTTVCPCSYVCHGIRVRLMAKRVQAITPAKLQLFVGRRASVKRERIPQARSQTEQKKETQEQMTAILEIVSMFKKNSLDMDICRPSVVRSRVGCNVSSNTTAKVAAMVRTKPFQEQKLPFPPIHPPSRPSCLAGSMASLFTRWCMSTR